ncbi:MAG: type IV secretion system DNA-binding domain-containing protein [bacterium]|nr:type IV secretion system DNA-binding domain-containing protein [bacterium]
MNFLLAATYQSPFEVEVAAKTSAGVGFPWWFILVVVLLAAGFLYFWWHRNKSHLHHNAKRFLNSVFLEIQVPKENTEKDAAKEPQKEEKEIISVAEQLFAALSQSSKGLLREYMQSTEHLSFEIVSFNKKISFFINCPRHLQDLVEKQVHAQYPKAQIEETEFYNIFRPNCAVSAAEFGLQKKYYYPIRTYKNLETDPLNAIANSLSKLSEDEAGVVQLVIAPARAGWGRKANRIALAVQQGKTPEAAERGIVGRVFHDLFYGFLQSGKQQQSQSPNRRRDLSGEHSPIQLTPMQQEVVKRLEEKSSKAGFMTNFRVVITSPKKSTADAHIRNIFSSLMQFSMTPFNGFRVKMVSEKRTVTDFIYRIFRESWPFKKFILNTEELTSLWHLPTKFMETPNIKWLHAKRAPAPVNVPAEGIILGENTFRGVKTTVKLATSDRRRHMYIIGRTGTGKSEFMKNMIIQDIKNGEGVAVVDPHGELVEGVLEHIPKERAEQVILFNPSDIERPLGLNMLEVKNPEMSDFAIQEMIEIFYKLFPPEMIGPMFEHNMRNVMMTLMADKDYPGTIAEVPRMFTDIEFQKYKVSKVTDPVVRNFWEKEMAKTSDFHKSEMLGYLISKVGRFVENEMMRNIIGQPKSAFDFREVMDQGKILLINLSKGQTGEVNSKLLGLIIVSKLQMAALSRADIPEDERRDFFLYVDEFQNFVTDSFATILSEARKYKLSLTIAHQYLGQLIAAAPGSSAQNSKIRDAVFGNVGTMACFRIGVEDAEVMGKEFSPVFSEFDVINIDRFQAYIKLMINGTASRPFNMATLPPPPGGSLEMARAIKELSRLKYGRPRAEVTADILERSKLGSAEASPFSIERTR